MMDQYNVLTNCANILFLFICVFTGELVIQKVSEVRQKYVIILKYSLFIYISYHINYL